MAKNAIVLRLKAANRYNVARPCQYILADGSASGITAGLKQASAGSTLLHGVAPDGGIAVADWKTAPMPTGRWTLYNGGAVAIGSVTGFAVIETPRQITILVETSGPLAGANSACAGEVLVANDSTLGESATYGHSDGRTIYGLLQGAPSNGTTSTWATVSGQQSCVFIGAESTRRLIGGAIGTPSTFTAAEMAPTGYGTGDWCVRECPYLIASSFRLGYPAWLVNCKSGTYWGALTVDGTASRRFGLSATVSHWTCSPKRKDGATADVITTRRTVATYATWPDFLQAVWDDISANGLYWEQDSSA